MQICFVFPLLISFILLCNSPVSLGTSTHGTTCFEPNYTSGSTFQYNLQQMLADLPLKAVQNNYFYNATYGKAPDQVYGLTMCYADASSAACNSCLFEASLDITDGCAFWKTGIAWYEACMIQYSDEVFKANSNVGMLGCAPKVRDSEPDSLAELKNFSDSMRQLADILATNASRSPLRLTAEKMNYTSSANIYALAQCTRQLPSDECRMCIHNLTDFGVEFCPGKTYVPASESLKAVSCYVRFALYPFYVISEANPPWSNSGKRSREPISTCTFTIVIGCLLVIVAHIHP